MPIAKNHKKLRLKNITIPTNMVKITKILKHPPINGEKKAPTNKNNKIILIISKKYIKTSLKLVKKLFWVSNYLI